MSVLAADAWATNGDLIADVDRLYPFGDRVLDATYGRGRFWTQVQPNMLVSNDLNPDLDVDHHYDFRSLPWREGEFPVVVFDPPYKLNGTPSLGDFDDRYGIGESVRWQDRMKLISDGAVECGRVASERLLVKCQDQVVSGKVRWQSLMVIGDLWAAGWELVDRFDMLGGGRPQPAGRRQVHAHGRPSSLLVFSRIGPLLFDLTKETTDV